MTRTHRGESGGMDLRSLALDDRVPTTTPADARRAALTVCEMVADPCERARFIDMLGLREAL